MNTALQTVFLGIPPTDMPFIQKLAKEKGWQTNDKESLLDKYIRSRPTNVNLTDEEIMEEVRAVRYGKVESHN
ncbi:hypothetical protein SAMD00024442_7_57 [Candidatus Symbiothrix dinenymphae]|nr:hypothetical protein SAMD00024442_7_57 [Candidatus Symbiothrix dinenymphae]